MKQIKVARGTARAARRAKMDYEKRGIAESTRPKPAALHRLAALLA